MKYFLIILVISNCFAKDFIASTLIELDTGKVISEENSQTPMILASVSKLFTTYFALSSLGPNYQFSTKIGYKGDINDGVLKGNVYLEGGGDPYLTMQDIVSLILKLKQKGINRVDGRFIVIDSYLFFTDRISELGQEDQPDNPSIGALNLEFNRIKIQNKEVFPDLDGIVLKENSKSRIDQNFSFEGFKNKTEIWSYNPKTKLKYIEEVPSRNSSLYAGKLFRFLAKNLGISLPEPEVGDGSYIELDHIQSLPLWRLVNLGIEYSNNIIAEMMLLSAIKEETGEKLNLHDSAKFMIKWLGTNVPNFNSKDLVMQNGSGVTIDNKVSPRTMVEYLRKIEMKNFEDRSFQSFLSLNGHSGGLKKILPYPKYAFKISGKSGSLFFVNNLAGYLTGMSGKRYAYAIFITEQNKRQKLNRKPSKALREEHKSWYRNSSQTLNNKLKEWIDKF